MSMERTELSRSATPSDPVEKLSSIEGNGFTLTPKETKIFLPTHAPIHIFYIEVVNGWRIGRMQTILEPDKRNVMESGHICEFMRKGNEDSALFRVHGAHQGEVTPFLLDGAHSWSLNRAAHPAHVRPAD